MGYMVTEVYYWLYLFAFCTLFQTKHQIFVPGRSGEIRDVIIDSSGSGTGILAYLVVVSLLKG